jgi:ABC-type nitrate/sulfonate/bicarbonate transport system permease component
MTSIAVERPREGVAGVNFAVRRGLLLVAVLALLCGLWEGFRALGVHFGWTHPFIVDDTSMPHIHLMIKALFEHPNPEAPLLVVTLLRAALFTAKEAGLGFAMGATGGVAIATLRGLHAADRRAVELMRSYAANRWTVLWKLRFHTSLPYLFSALRISATASIVGAIIGELPSSISGGLGGAILNFAQYYSFQPQNLWATNIIAALLGISFFLVVVAAEKIVVRRAPENVA